MCEATYVKYANMEGFCRTSHIKADQTAALLSPLYAVHSFHLSTFC